MKKLLFFLCLITSTGSLLSFSMSQDERYQVLQEFQDAVDENKKDREEQLLLKYKDDGQVFMESAVESAITEAIEAKNDVKSAELIARYLIHRHGVYRSLSAYKVDYVARDVLINATRSGSLDSIPHQYFHLFLNADRAYQKWAGPGNTFIDVVVHRGYYKDSSAHDPDDACKKLAEFSCKLFRPLKQELHNAKQLIATIVFTLRKKLSEHVVIKILSLEKEIQDHAVTIFLSELNKDRPITSNLLLLSKDVAVDYIYNQAAYKLEKWLPSADIKKLIKSGMVKRLQGIVKESEKVEKSDSNNE